MTRLDRIEALPTFPTYRFGGERLETVEIRIDDLRLLIDTARAAIACKPGHRVHGVWFTDVEPEPRHAPDCPACALGAALAPLLADEEKP